MVATHEAWIKPIHSGNDTATFDILIRETSERGSGSYKSPTPITVRVTVHNDELKEELSEDHWSYNIRDHRYLLAKVRDILASALSGPWSEKDSSTIHPPLSVQGLRKHLW